MDTNNRDHRNIKVQHVTGSNASNINRASCGNSMEYAIQDFLDKPADSLIIVGGVIGTLTLRHLAEKCKTANQILEPHSNERLRSVTLPSQRRDYLTVQLITIGRYKQNGVSKPVAPRKEVRDTVTGQLAREIASYADDSSNGYDRIRSIKFYGQNYFTVEQQAIFVHLSTEEKPSVKWSGILLNDVGFKRENSAWQTSKPLFHDAEFLPMTVHEFAEATPLEGYGDAVAQPNPFGSRRDDNATLLKKEPPLSYKSAFLFAANLMVTSALSWNQFLAFLRNFMIKNMPEEDPAESLRILNQTRAHLSDVVCYFDDVLTFLDGVRRHNSFGYSSGSARDNPSAIADDQERDFRALRADALEVSNMCKEKIEAINSTIALQTSQAALEEGRHMTYVTYLAIIYAALSLSSSIFGMNIKELGNEIHIYYFFGLSVFIVLITMALTFLLKKLTQAKAGFVWIWKLLSGLIRSLKPNTRGGMRDQDSV